MLDIENFINEAVRGSAECVQWQASDLSEDGNGYPISDGGDDYTDAVEDAVRETVEDFVNVVSRIDDVWQRVSRSDRYQGADGAQLFGHDFVLSANHHGTGFWDRGLGSLGVVLHGLSDGFSIDAEFELWGDEADGTESTVCSDEVMTLWVGNTAIVINGELAPEGYSE